MPREGSCALASLGNVKKFQEADLVAATGRQSNAVKQILDVLAEPASARRARCAPVRGFPARDAPLTRGFFVRSVIIDSWIAGET
jgi:hypothetical protein